MLHTIFLTIFFYLIASSAASSTPTRFLRPKANGFTAPLIPPTSPRSPFYSQILAANNISATLPNITLNRTHYEKWLETKTPKFSKNDYSFVTYNKYASYYVMGLFIGDPMQVVYGVFDTGSDIVWIQCQNDDETKKNRFPYFNQFKSNRYEVIGCSNKYLCQTDYTRSVRCSRIPGDNSCRYVVAYADGDSSSGALSLDIITMKPSMSVSKFVFGCSSDNPERVPGIIGAGNSIYSIPRQLFPDDPKFSYCISGKTEDVNFVRFGNDAQLLGNKVTIFRHDNDPYYFMDVIGMKVNGIDIKVDPSAYLMSSDGSTGFVIDSGFEYTSLTHVIFDALKDSLRKILGEPMQYQGFEICYQFGTVWRPVEKPVIAIKFRDWVFELNESSVWWKMYDPKVECLIFVRSVTIPYSMLGAQQLFGVNVGHDLNNNLLYLQPMKCPTSY